MKVKDLVRNIAADNTIVIDSISSGITYCGKAFLYDQSSPEAVVFGIHSRINEVGEDEIVICIA